MDSARLLLRGVFSQEDSPRAGLPPGSGFHSEFFGPMRVGASANLGAFFVKLRLKPLPFGLAVRPQRIRGLSDLRFPKCRGEIRWTALWRSIAITCISLAFRFGGHSRQLPALLIER